MGRINNKKFFPLVYQDKRPMMFMELEYYNCRNKELKKPGDEIMASESERCYLLKLKNGNPKKGGISLFIDKPAEKKLEKED